MRKLSLGGSVTLQGHAARTHMPSSGCSGAYLLVSHCLKYLSVLCSLILATTNSSSSQRVDNHPLPCFCTQTGLISEKLLASPPHF